MQGKVFHWFVIVNNMVYIIDFHIAPETNVFYIGPGNLTKQIVAANNCMGYTVGWDRNILDYSHSGIQ